MDRRIRRFILLLLSLLVSFSFAKSQSYIGVNYGEVADNLPPPDATARLLKTTSISKVRLYGADPAIIRALAGTNISLVIGAANGDIPALATDPSAATRWIAANVLPFVPDSQISVVAVGNEVIESGDATLAAQLLPAMQNLLSAAAAAGGAAAGIKISTVNTMAVLSQSDPPSTGAFHPEIASNLQQILGFLQKTNSPFMINPYPYFAYQSDPRPETLAFCLFQPNSGRLDAGSKITYTNMFDAQLDAVKSALGRVGFPDAEIVVAETGWPYRGDAGEAGATVENARAYNGNLVAHLRSQVGTPLMPGRSVDTYIFALYDEDLKPGPTSERSFGLFRPDLTPTYDAGLLLSGTAPSTAPSSSGQGNSTSSAAAGWCVPKAGATDDELQADLDYACGQGGVDCRPIQPGGPCYLPNTVRSHAAYAMNQLYQMSGKHPWNCDFQQSAVLTSDNPSYDGCAYTGR
ncbi:glucan endo-1,3-beta-glucosidase 7-like [Ananas comosus]|uniref:glucan endo-1,3-beta-D-glucosidase n=1 Tax=Ananas comosus TaxID=4615 RepID=A0A199VWA5_ANACO|nr:glucan endo-1,3-beta-glucosidase 7-like [Ananas comosus]OAY80975.1 Glucan endo-1,3-beta-glucosidase 7 [Ananas comosus]